MLRFTAGAALAVAAFAAEEAPIEGTADYSEKYEKEASYLPTDFYGGLDLAMGLIVGVYSPIQDRWRYGDCRAKFYTLGLDLLSYAKYFDKPYGHSIGDYLNTGLQASMSSYLVYKTADSCIAQWNDIQNVDDWTVNFDLLADTPTVQAGYSTSYKAIHGLKWLLQVKSAYELLGYGDYWFYTGKAVGGVIGYAITGADIWFDAGIITPEKPWDRYYTAP